MRGIRGCAIALVMMTAACGSSDAAPGGTTSGGVVPPGNGAPPGANDPPPVPGAPSANDLDEKLGVFVAEKGDDAGDGSRAKPFKTITHGLEVGKATKRRVYVCRGTYKEALVLLDAIPIIGGLECATPAWDIGTGRSRVESPTSPAARAENVTTTTRVDRLEVIAPDATDPSGSSIALLAKGSPGLQIVGARFVAGKGADGASGADVPALTQANPNGGNGFIEQVCVDAGCVPKPASLGGSGACAGAAGHDAENGGAGGTGGVYTAILDPETITGYFWRVYGGIAANAAKPGEARTGAAGDGGEDGAPAREAFAFAQDAFEPANGNKGADGSGGKGGSGGNGGRPITEAKARYPGSWHGFLAAGGGAGGCPGLAGGEGKGGGASVGLVLLESPATIATTEIVAGAGGRGGAGSLGPTPLAGGAPGSNFSMQATAAGQPGGRGGFAGMSTSGNGGPSIGIAHRGAAPKLTDTTPVVGAGGAGADAVPDAREGANRTLAASKAGVASAIQSFQ